MRLTDLYDTDDLFDTTEMLGLAIMDRGNRTLNFDFEVKDLGPKECLKLCGNDFGTTLAEVFALHASKKQRALGRKKAKAFVTNRVVILNDGRVIDGQHHVMAAISLGLGVKAIDLEEMEIDYAPAPVHTATRPETVILVHPGSFFVSAAAQVDPEIHAGAAGALWETLRAARNLLIIDGMLSEAMTLSDQRSLREVMTLVDARGGFAARIWGCDSGERPGPEWAAAAKGPYATVICDCQQEAILHALPDLPEGSYRLVGAWCGGESPDDSGCVNSVWQSLLSAGHEDISIGPGICREEWLEDSLEELPEP